MRDGQRYHALQVVYSYAIRVPVLYRTVNIFIFIFKATQLPSVEDTKTLNLDPYPECWPNLDPDRRVMLLILNTCKKKIVSYLIFLPVEIMAPEIFVSLLNLSEW